jgi:hypothetical protein
MRYRNQRLVHGACEPARLWVDVGIGKVGVRKEKLRKPLAQVLVE